MLKDNTVYIYWNLPCVLCKLHGLPAGDPQAENGVQPISSICAHTYTTFNLSSRMRGSVQTIIWPFISTNISFSGVQSTPGGASRLNVLTECSREFLPIMFLVCKVLSCIGFTYTSHRKIGNHNVECLCPTL